MVSGAQAVTELSFDGTNYTEVTQRGLGLDSINIAWSTGTTNVGGGGNIEYMERSGYAQAQVAFAVDDTPQARKLFFGAPGSAPGATLGRKGARTIDTGVIVAGPNWAVDLQEDVSGWNLAGRGSHQFFARVGGAEVAEFKDADLFGIGLDITLPSIYYGDHAKLLHEHRRDDEAWAFVYDTDAKLFCLGHVSLENLPRQQPTNSRITNSLTMHNNGPFYSNEGKVVAFDAGTSVGSKTIEIEDVVTGERIFLIVTEYTSGVSAADVTGGPATVEVDGVGVYDLGAATADGDETLTLSHTISANQNIKGFAVAGPDFDPNGSGAGWKHGRNMWVRNMPEGRSAGLPVETWQGRVTLQLAAGAEGRRRISGSQGVNGAVTVGVQS